MYIPTTQNVTALMTSVVSDSDPLCSTRTLSNSYLGAVIVAFLILMFYALALWDRWMYLKSKDIDKLSKLQSNPSKPSINYGSTLHVPTPAEACSRIRIEDHHERRPLIPVRKGAVLFEYHMMYNRITTNGTNLILGKKDRCELNHPQKNLDQRCKIVI
ncbi:hypothetical protein J3R30DRAFT_3403041 [Lentinula aciculospora]|uniref:Uncharacterized protein n=1 Tax=Lentinula aciculospora TaxID=153920 RepID=A0A9W9AGU7_9AGAR|nr:hypothetical protein J3R30DRAFT_3403041 [Lentinula aciculospora]